ncbi:uncharacterized protein BJ212DRAFT_1396348 [Suillus subaureus]|uniref:Berberine/berberine-like domain-containing protein n=1 Tax=Suillus subaureus TaxID=48587 RepID=A0A9P7J590_9AGAM|nr:uncharacterized protein BJ212DRAFT_1396348 [Suillus subaureus]KAG1803355.1 hypothetical protein BJ212DRAFT_1396348 [Suillus subaureus]
MSCLPTLRPLLTSHSSQYPCTYVPIQFNIHPFDKILSTTYPPSRSQGYSYAGIYYGWKDASYDDMIFETVNASAQHITQSLVNDGQDVTNVAVYTRLEIMYGDNVPRLQAIKNAVDPDNVMALAGGWRF